MAELPAREPARADAVSSFVTCVPAHPDDNLEHGTGTSPQLTQTRTAAERGQDGNRCSPTERRHSPFSDKDR